jgi:Predicted naringenin-chalcone synthase
MRIASAASAFPQHYYSQEMLLEALQEYWGAKVENPHVLRRLHKHVGVDGRFLALPKEEYVKMRTWGKPIITGFAPPRSWARRPCEAPSRQQACTNEISALLFCIGHRHQ